MKLINADCIKAMKAMPDNSVDAIVTDPPYELGFMGKSWDASGIAFNVDVWREALRVIKPGGHLIAFSGSRTYHRMAVAIEDAGFEIRDQIMWVYGSGFPKSHNISKAIDKAAGAEREVVGTYQGATNIGKVEDGKRGYSPGTDYPEVDRTVNITAPATPAAQQWDGWGTALKPAHEPMVLARKPLIGTVANNVLTYGTGGLNIDGSRVGTEIITNNINDFSNQHGNNFGNGKPIAKLGESQVVGRFPANFIHDGSDEVVALFPDTNKSRSALMGKGGDDKGNSIYGKYADIATVRGHDDNGGSAARFFYCAKASKRDRNEGTANNHPTVKPTTLMQYLVRLVTPPKGIVLDPFMGSGSTGKACAYEGFDFIGIDQSAEYVAIAQARIDFALADKSEL